MYYITLFINTGCLTGVISYLDIKGFWLIVKRLTETKSIDDDITTMLPAVIRDLIIPTDKSKAILRLIFVDNYTLQRGLLPIPDVSLKEYEVETYVTNSLTKLFRSKEILAYDYHTRLKSEIRQIVVYAYPEWKLHKLLAVCTPYRVDFIGITQDFVDSLTNEKYSETLFDKLACVSHIHGFNLLPWRKKIKKRKQMIFLWGAISSILSLVLILYWLFTQKIENQYQLNLKYQSLYSDVIQHRAHLSRLDELNSQLQNLQANLQQEVNKQMRLKALIASLILIASKRPDGLWLKSLFYRDDQILLTGESFSYAEILAFSLSLATLTSLSNKVLAIKDINNLLQFDMDIQLINVELNDEYRVIE